MARIIQEEGLSFDDVYLKPRKSRCKSRFDGSIDLSVQLTPKIKLKVPFITAAMDTITDSRMANEMGKLGGLGIIHRFFSDDDYVAHFMSLDLNKPRVAGIGLGEKGFERLNYIEATGTFPEAVHIDVAYANTPMMFEFVKKVKEKYPDLDVIVGSVATREGVRLLCEAGVDAIRLNIGGGSRCSTRINTGNGIPVLTSIMWAKEVVDIFEQQTGKRPSLICDGGVKNAGDCMKGLAAGADAIMSGYLFAGTDETPGNKVKDLNGGYVKEYSGMSSLEAQNRWKGKATSIEGEATYLPCKGPVKEVLNSLVCNLLSGMSYQNAFNIKELQENAEFIKITPLGFNEGETRK